MKHASLALLIASVVMLGGCASQNPRSVARANFQAPGQATRTLAVYMPWFGNRDHIDVGYSSHDPAVLRRQVEKARAMGISGFVVDWYGPRNAFIDRSYSLLQQVAADTDFRVALMYDEPGGGEGDGTDEAIAALDYAYRNYIGPDSPVRDAYLRYQQRPVIFIFPKMSHTDWSRVRRHTDSWEAAPLLIYKDHPPQNLASVFDGFYAWVHPGRGWSPDGSDWGRQYLENFYSTMKNRYPDKLVVGAAWPGFDDSRAHWGLNRRMDPRCGRTLDDTYQMHREFFDDRDPLPFMLIETWNDYEEGTQIENRSFTHCAG